MSERLTKRDVITLVSQANIEPSDALISDIRKEYLRNPAAFSNGTAAKKKIGLSTAKVFVVSGILCALVIVCVVLGLGKYHSATAEEYSVEPFAMISRNDVSAQFIENESHSKQMMDNFRQRLTKTPALGEYTIDGIRADDYPGYYAGSYINVDGKLIVMIKETYFKKDYRSCDWYKELSGVFGSEDFACRSVKYNYTEIIHGCSALVYEESGRATQMQTE